MTATDPTPPRDGTQRPRQGWRWLLVASLALNLAVVGVVVGTIVAGRADGPPRGFDLAIGPVARALERDDRRAIMRDLMARRDLRPRDDSVRAAENAALVAAIRAEPFDPGAVAGLLAEMGARGDAVRQATESALVARIAAMPPARRQAFAERLAHELGHEPDQDVGHGSSPRD